MALSNILHKNKFRISLFNTCPIYGILIIDSEKKGYLKYYDEKGEIEVDLENYNKLVTDSIMKQAETICSMKYATLWSY